MSNSKVIITSGARQLISIAKKELGYLEKNSNSQLDDKTANAGKKNYTKYTRDLDILGFFNGPKQGFAWCSVFTSWCFYKAFGLNSALALTCQALGGLGAGVKYAAQNYLLKDQFVSDPQPGDQIFFGKRKNGKISWLHTGIVTDVSDTRVYTIEGNTNSGPDVISNGGAVVSKSYLLTNPSIMGYGRPNWSIVESEKDKVEETEEPEMRIYGTLKDVPTWYQSSIRKAIEKKVLVGYDEKDYNTIDDNVINVTEDYCRTMVALDRLGLLD